MECDKCSHDTVMHMAYPRAHFCDDRLCASVKERVRRYIHEGNMLPRDASPEDSQMWAIGLSSNKDGVIPMRIPDDTFGHDPCIEFVALTIHKGIEDYRDKFVNTCVELTGDLGIHHELITYENEFGV